jgi:hypothetical protein
MSALLLIAVVSYAVSMINTCPVIGATVSAWDGRSTRQVARSLPLRAASGGVVVEPSLVMVVP